MDYAEWKSKYVDRKLANGALNDKNAPTGKRRDTHAELFYNEWRNSKKRSHSKKVSAEQRNERKGGKVCVVATIPKYNQKQIPYYIFYLLKIREGIFFILSRHSSECFLFGGIENVGKQRRNFHRRLPC